MNKKQKVLVLTPTPNEFRYVSRHVSEASFANLEVRVVASGPGKVNAAFTVASEVKSARHKGESISFIVGAGTCGSLSLDLTAGDLIISGSTLISDWQCYDGREAKIANYGTFKYESLTQKQLELIILETESAVVKALLPKAEKLLGFKSGRLLSSDTFVVGKDFKLSLGQKFGCHACDMESGVFAYAAKNLLGNLAWFNIRVVADTLDDSLADYLRIEKDMTQILGAGVVRVLSELDQLV